ncbi:AHH domain-containing protein [Vibrio splendidus]|nr:AHH domain-containing protein [Vibrio splendidus]MDH5885570.1 AHH domain-containing protein [Vibrio splendidus]
MDTHHIISAEAVKHSELGENLVNKGYDINQLSNLIGFPATLPGDPLQQFWTLSYVISHT